METNPAPRHHPPQDHQSDADLVARARTGDERAVRALIRRCNQQLFRVARAIVHDDTAAEDVVQAAYMRAFTRLETFRGDSAFATWMTRIVMNEAYGHLRRQGPVVQLDDYRNATRINPDADGSTLMSPSPPTPDTELARKEVRLFLEAAIDTLPEPFRLTYVLRDVQGLPTREVATLMGVRGVTVKTRLFRARRLLRARFEHSFSREFSGIFPFDGARCVGMADRVVTALRQNRRP